MQEHSKKINVLIADKSSYGRLVLEAILTEDDDLQVAALAGDGDELISLLRRTKPDVVLLNNNLPKNTRLFTLKRISSDVPTPVVLMVGCAELTLELVQEALEAGVYAIVLKPEGKQLPDYRSVESDIRTKLKAVRQVDLWDTQQRMQFVQHDVALVPEKVPVVNDKVQTIVVIGASTGGTQAVEQIIKELANDTGACFLIAVHLPAGFTHAFAKRLQILTALPVKEGKKGLMLKPNTVIIAPGGQHMIIQKKLGNTALRIGFSEGLAESYDQPSIDLLMQSAAITGVEQVIGVILTGLGQDGTKGAAMIRENGGIVIAQNEETSAIFGMAKSAIASGKIKEVLPLPEIPHFINEYIARNRQSVSITDMTHEIERTGI